MAPILVLLLAALQPLWALYWDVAVASEGRLDLLRDGSSVRTVTNGKLIQARGLVYLPKQEAFLFSNSQRSVSSSIFTLKINDSTNTTQVTPLIEANSADRKIKSLAYDPIDDHLYWTDTKARAIYKAKILEEPLHYEILHKFVDEVPESLAIDHCRRKIYWSNTNSGSPTIESSDLDGSNRLVVVSRDLNMPNGIALDLRGDGRLFWLDDLEGITFSVNSAQLDGSDRKELHRGRHQVPYTLITSMQETLLWTDRTHDLVWKMDLRSSKPEPSKYFGVPRYTPLSVVVNTPESYYADVCRVNEEPVATTSLVPILPKSESSLKIIALVFCLNGGVNNTATGSCECLPGFSGAQCEVDHCHNYCLSGGICMISPQGAASCHCPPGMCELDLCQGLCLNDGSCHLNLSTNHTVCQCSEEFEGERCERRRDVCSVHCNIPACDQCETSKDNCTSPPTATESPFNVLVLSLAVACSLLVATTIFLVYQVLKLRKRPRLKRRVIVSRKEVNVPSFEQPSANGQNGSAGDSCEITIENCCNMNICETPCFEPPNRFGRKKKEDKKTLLANMEDSDVEEQESSKESSYS